LSIKEELAVLNGRLESVAEIAAEVARRLELLSLSFDALRLRVGKGEVDVL